MAIENKGSNIKQSFGNASKYGVQGAKRDNDRDDRLQGAKGVHGHKTENEKSNDVADSVKIAFPDVAIVLPTQQFDDPKHQFEQPSPATTIQAGHGINISKVENDYMVSVDVEEVENSVKPSNPVISSNPWTVSVFEDTAIVGSGSLLSYQESSLTLREFKYFAGASPAITVTGAGSIYGNILGALALGAEINVNGTDSNGDTFTAPINRVFPDDTQDVYFTFETTPPAVPGTFYFEIAKVDLVDGAAVVTRQILTHNPTLMSFIEPP